MKAFFVTICEVALFILIPFAIALWGEKHWDWLFGEKEEGFIWFFEHWWIGFILSFLIISVPLIIYLIFCLNYSLLK